MDLATKRRPPISDRTWRFRPSHILVERSTGRRVGNLIWKVAHQLLWFAATYETRALWAFPIKIAGRIFVTKFAIRAGSHFALATLQCFLVALVQGAMSEFVYMRSLRLTRAGTVSAGFNFFDVWDMERLNMT